MSDVLTGDAEYGDSENTLLLKLATAAQGLSGGGGGGGAPTGAAGGDLSGSYPNPAVAKLAGVTPTAAFLTLADDADIGAIRSTLGLGTLATQSGTFSGTSSGANTGDQDLSGLVPVTRTVNGQALSGNITVTAAAGTLTGTTLAATVVTSSLTSVGTLVGGATGAGFTIAFAASTLTGAVPIANGGTGAITAILARAALGAAAVQNTVQAANQVVTNSTTLVSSTDCAMTLQPGTYLCESYEVVLNSSTTNLAKTQVTFSGTATSAGATIRRVFATATDGANLAPVYYPQSSGAIGYNTSQANFGSNRSMLIHRRFPLVVTVAGTLSIQFATAVASDGGTATLLPSSFLTAIQQA